MTVRSPSRQSSGRVVQIRKASPSAADTRLAEYGWLYSQFAVVS